MSTEKDFLDEQAMTDLARKSIEVLRQQGASPAELRRLEILLKDGSVGEAFIMSSLLRTILAEMSPEASQNLYSDEIGTNSEAKWHLIRAKRQSEKSERSDDGNLFIT